MAASLDSTTATMTKRWFIYDDFAERDEDPTGGHDGFTTKREAEDEADRRNGRRLRTASPGCGVALRWRVVSGALARR